MSEAWRSETRRLAELARLELSVEEADALAEACSAIARDFADLAAYAARLPTAEPEAPAAPRDDRGEAAPPGEVDAILRAAPKVDAASRAVLVPRGLP